MNSQAAMKIQYSRFYVQQYHHLEPLSDPQADRLFQPQLRPELEGLKGCLVSYIVSVFREVGLCKTNQNK